MDFGKDKRQEAGVELVEMRVEDECPTPSSVVSEMGLTRRRVRTLQRSHAKARAVVNLLPSRSIGRAFLASYDDVDGSFFSRPTQANTVDLQAEQIAQHLAQDKDLMEDNKKSEMDRMQTLREMPENLTLKRAVKTKLTKTISKQGRRKQIGYIKRLQYQTSIFISHLTTSVKNLLYSSELWYNSLKTIEGHFGSGVATYFKFLRLLFILNIIVLLLSLAFLVTPQLVFHYNQETNSSRIEDGGGGGDFTADNIFTGEGYLSWTVLYYGFYTNNTISLWDGWSFHVPTAYFFTSLSCYFLVFLSLAVSLAVSYRKSYIETAGGVKNVFAHKVFCGWDFSIVTKQAAHLKSKSLYTELKELLDEQQKPPKERTLSWFIYSIAMHLSLNALLVVLIGALGYYMWVFLNGDTTQYTNVAMAVSVVLALVVTLAPTFFSWVVRFEDYDTPRAMLYVTIVRIFLLDVVIIGVVAAFRVDRAAQTECWETVLAQDMYRLVLLDFFLNLLGTVLAEFCRSRLVRWWPAINYPEFDVARNSMSLIYNQTLFYVGLYFSPLLSFIIVLKMLLTFYIRKLSALHHCRPPVRPWRAAQSQTVFLALATFAFFLVIIGQGYILTSVKTSMCGPFRGRRFTYATVLETILPGDGEEEPIALTVVLYAARPGVVGVLLFLLLLAVYYLRSVAYSRRHVVHILQQILADKARDKELLLQEIEQFTKAGGDGRQTTQDMFQGVMLERQHSTASNASLGKGDRHVRKGGKNRLKQFRSTQHLDALREDNRPAGPAGGKGWKSVDNLDHGLNTHASQMRLVDHPVDTRGSSSHSSQSRLIESRSPRNWGYVEDDYDDDEEDRNEVEGPGTPIYTVSHSSPDEFPTPKGKVNFNPVYSPSEELQEHYDYPYDDLTHRRNRGREDNGEESSGGADGGGIGARKSYTRQSYDDKVPSRIGFSRPQRPRTPLKY